MKIKKVIYASLVGLGFSVVSPLVTTKVEAAEDTTNTFNVESVVQQNSFSDRMLLESKTAIASNARDSMIGPGASTSSLRGFKGSGVALAGGAAAYQLFSPHKKNARKSTHDKHTKKRPEGKEKKKAKSNWKKNR